ncbi:unnamed protein product [Amoebophrya sp. A25]|nr:unnamed protein product [Amoebophrya sp. A25]|eukprot:GSA25T00013195001.1
MLVSTSGEKNALSLATVDEVEQRFLAVLDPDVKELGMNLSDSHAPLSGSKTSVSSRAAALSDDNFLWDRSDGGSTTNALKTQQDNYITKKMYTSRTKTNTTRPASSTASASMHAFSSATSCSSALVSRGNNTSGSGAPPPGSRGSSFSPEKFRHPSHLPYRTRYNSSSSSVLSMRPPAPSGNDMDHLGAAESSNTISRNDFQEKLQRLTELQKELEKRRQEPTPASSSTSAYLSSQRAGTSHHSKNFEQILVNQPLYSYSFLHDDHTKNIVARNPAEGQKPGATVSKISASTSASLEHGASSTRCSSYATTAYYNTKDPSSASGGGTSKTMAQELQVVGGSASERAYSPGDLFPLTKSVTSSATPVGDRISSRHRRKSPFLGRAKENLAEQKSLTRTPQLPAWTPGSTSGLHYPATLSLLRRDEHSQREKENSGDDEDILAQRDPGRIIYRRSDYFAEPGFFASSSSSRRTPGGRGASASTLNGSRRDLLDRSSTNLRASTDPDDIFTTSVRGDPRRPATEEISRFLSQTASEVVSQHNNVQLRTPATPALPTPGSLFQGQHSTYPEQDPSVCETALCAAASRAITPYSTHSRNNASAQATPATARLPSAYKEHGLGQSDERDIENSGTSPWWDKEFRGATPSASLQNKTPTSGRTRALSRSTLSLSFMPPRRSSLRNRSSEPASRSTSKRSRSRAPEVAPAVLDGLPLHAFHPPAPAGTWHPRHLVNLNEHIYPTQRITTHKERVFDQVTSAHFRVPLNPGSFRNHVAAMRRFQRDRKSEGRDADRGWIP